MNSRPHPNPLAAPESVCDPARDANPDTHPAPIRFTDPWQYELSFPCDPRGPRVARAILRAVLAAHGLVELAYRAELLASELTTNSVRHTKGPASVRLHWTFPVLRVSVWDMSPDLPEPRHLRRPRRDADSGRGLVILDLVADRWGGCAIGEGPYGPGGKTIWFELALDEGPSTGSGSTSALLA
ncbi:ATP-binding protein [Streptomyces sp. NPDC102274]|uniref:ATP-binding protein n=1 Tax=Streptomyces sp. NPDC102274 TaxID=3366151 RepID=UPI0037FED1EE